MNIVALIPARGGSKRIPRKNMKPLGGKPLIQWTLEAARRSGVFSAIAVCTEDYGIVEWMFEHSAERCVSRSPESAADDAPDIRWVREVLPAFPDADAFAILRPTSPFRTADTIRRAVEQFTDAPCSSIRAVEPVKQHPGKMWQRYGGGMVPLIEGWTWPGDAIERPGDVPFHSRPTQTLPPVYVQNASLELAHTWCVTVFNSISGPKVAPFYTDGWEGFDINTPDDWDRAEAHAQTLLARS